MQFRRPIQCGITALVGCRLLLGELGLLDHLYLLVPVLGARHHSLALDLQLVGNLLQGKLLAVLRVAYDFGPRVGCRVLISPALITGLALLRRGPVVRHYLCCLRSRQALLLCRGVLARPLGVVGRLLLAPENIWVRWLLLLLVLFIGLFKFEIFRSNDRRADLFGWLEVLQHEQLACLLRVGPVVGGVRLYADGGLGVLDLVGMSGLYNSDFGSVSHILLLDPLLIYWAQIDPAHQPALTCLFHLLIHVDLLGLG